MDLFALSVVSRTATGDNPARDRILFGECRRTRA